MPVKEKKLTGKQIARVLEKARKLMNNSGEHWIKGEFKCKLLHPKTDAVIGYAYCARGAIRESMLTLYPGRISTDYIDEEDEGEAPVLDALRKFLPKHGMVENWNDAPKRTWKQVDEAFRKAAELARESG